MDIRWSQQSILWYELQWIILFEYLYQSQDTIILMITMQWTYYNMTEIAAGIIPTSAGELPISISLQEVTAPVDGIELAIHSGISFCYQGNDTETHADRGVCSSTFFSTNGTSYQNVCGRTRGYQKGNTVGFWGYHTAAKTIDGILMLIP